MATLPPLYDPQGSAAQIAAVLLNEPIAMPAEKLDLPVTRHSKLGFIADALMENPADRRTVGEWGKVVALGERTLMGLVVAETGMTFSRWRQYHCRPSATVRRCLGAVGFRGAGL